jgi:hypothetical protein
MCTGAGIGAYGEACMVLSFFALEFRGERDWGFWGLKRYINYF